MNAAITTAAPAPPPAPPSAREGAARPTDAPAFAALVDALAPAPPQSPDPGGSGPTGAGRRAPHKAGGEPKPPTRQPLHLEQALANLPLALAPAPAARASEASPPAAGPPASPQPALAPRGPLLALASPPPAEASAIPPATPLTNLPLAQSAPAAPPPALSSAPANDWIDPALNAQPARARTFLALALPQAVARSDAGAAPNTPLAPSSPAVMTSPADPPSAAQGATPPQANPGVAASISPAPAPFQSDPRPGARAAPVRPLAAAARSPVRTAAAAGPLAATQPASDAAQPPAQAVHARADNRKNTAPPDTALASAAALAASPPSAAVGPQVFDGQFKPAQLPQFLAAQRDALQSAAAPRGAATPARAPDVVKELAVELAPAGLGAVSVRMRLSEGKLAVVIDVANVHALKQVEGERAALAASLGSAAQPLDSLLIKQSDSPRSQGDNSDAPYPQRDSRKDSQSQPERESAQGQYFERRRTPEPAAPLLARRDGDLLV